MSQNPAAGAVMPTAVRGIALYTLATFLFAVMDAMIKWLAAGYPTMQIVFFRCVFGLLPVMVLILRAGGFRLIRTGRPWLQLLRGLFILCTTGLFFFAYSQMPLADAYAIAFAAPLFITALSVPMLGEKVGIRRWSAVVVGFVGVMIMLRPGTTDLSGFFSLGALAALGGTFFYALSATLIRLLSRTESNEAMTLYSTVVAAVGSAVFLPFDFRMPEGSDWLLLIAIGLIGGVAMLIMTEAFRVAPVAVLAPFEYTAMLWAVLFGYWIWGDLPDAWIAVGSTIVVASGLYIVHRETRRRAEAKS